MAAAAAGAVAGWSLPSAGRIGASIPLIVAVAAVIGILVLTRFAGYVLLMLAVRSCLDLFRVSGPTAGRGVSPTERALDASTLLALLFLLAAGLWLAARFRQHGRLRMSPLSWSFLLVAGTALVSAAGAVALGSSLLEVLRIVTVVTMLVVLEQLLPDRVTVRRLLLACYLSLALALGYTLLMAALGAVPAEVKGDFTRISGPFTQSTTFGRYLMFLVVFGFAVHPYLGRWWRHALGVLLALSLVFLLLTNTRSAILGTALGLVVVALLRRSVRLLAALVVVAVLAVATLPAVGERFAQLGASRAVGGGPTGNTLAWRMDYWAEVVTLAKRNPVTGIGPNMTQHQTDEAKKPHNDLLRAYVETGLVGLGAYLLLLVMLLRTGVRALRRAPPKSLERGVAVGFVGCTVTFVAVSLASNVISNVATLWYFVAFAAAAGVTAYGAVGAGPGERGGGQLTADRVPTGAGRLAGDSVRQPTPKDR